MATVYIETSIVSYLRTRPSAQIITAARQLLTQQWWENERHRYDLVTSEFVINEAKLGNATLAKERLSALDGIRLLQPPPAIRNLSEEILSAARLPRSAQLDSLHIAIAAMHNVDYLLTWNCRHIANAQILPKLRLVLTRVGFATPVLCTPQELYWSGIAP